jgi:chromosome segregation ATPase
MEQYEAIKRKEDEAGGELRDAQTELQAAAAAFNEVEARRLDTFNAAFEHICHHIDPIFKVPSLDRILLVTPSWDPY